MAYSDIREPVVAGTFYPASPGALREQLASFVDSSAERLPAFGCVLPHAGYAYSGAVAGKTISRVEIRDRVILFGPNHTGRGADLSVVTEGAWRTPLGETAIDSELASAFTEASRYLEPDTEAHAGEHSLEVELPFLQYLHPMLRIVPIAFKSADLEVLKAAGNDIASVIREKSLRDQVLLLASSDMTHYETEHEARRKDTAAIQAIRKLDEDMLFDTVGRLDVSMCGYLPVAAMIACAKALGARSAQLVDYRTSGDVTGDRSSVVGYAGIIIE